jgi:hypothetical protein
VKFSRGDLIRQPRSVLGPALWSLQSFNSRLDPPPHSATLQIAMNQHPVDHAACFDQRISTMPLNEHVGGSEDVEFGNQSSFTGRSTMPPSRQP